MSGMRQRQGVYLSGNREKRAILWIEAADCRISGDWTGRGGLSSGSRQAAAAWGGQANISTCEAEGMSRHEYRADVLHVK